MAALLPGESSHCAISAQDKPEEGVGRWYFTRKEIEENSPSRRHGIDLKKETYLRKSYCTFLQDLGMRLNVPQVTIATAITFCHRFFLRQSHAKNDRWTIGIVCMFLAGKVEGTPCPLKDVILVSYEIIHKKYPTSAQRIKQKEVYEQQKEIILLGERVVLATLGFDLNVHHPYKPVVHAVKKFEVARNALAQVAQNFVNDGLRTLLCLQFKPHHIAAGAIFLAAKLLKVKLPSDGEKVWWQEFDVTPRQLEEVCNQMLELYEQNRVPPSQGSEVEGSPGGGPSQRAAAKTPAVIEEHASKQSSLHSVPERLDTDSQVGLPGTTENQDNVSGSVETDSVITDHKVDVETKDNQQAVHVSYKENMREVHSKSRSGAEQYVGEDQIEGVEAGKWRDDAASCKSNAIVGQKLDLREGPVSQSSKEVIKKIDKDRVKAALEKRRKSRGEMTRKKEVLDEDDLIERELEDGVELAAEDEKTKREKGQSWSKFENPNYGKDASRGLEVENAEEGEMLEDASPMSNRQKRKAGSTIHTHSEGKKQHHYMKNYNQDDADDNQELCG